MFMPFNILGIWLRGLVALAVLGGGIYLLVQWYNHRETLVTDTIDAPQDREQAAGAENGQRPAAQENARVRVDYWQFGLNRETAFLVGGAILLGWSIGGGWVMNPRWLRRRGEDEPKAANTGDSRRLRQPDGSQLRVECFGPMDGSPVVLTHGWGLDSDEWYYARIALAVEHRVIVWDLPGLGQSDRPADRDWSLEKLARALDQVVATAGGKPVTLIGHSIGAMITLTYCKLFPEALGSRVRGLVLAHGTYTNPVRTTSMAGLYTILQKPLLEPLCHLMVWLSPVVRVLNWFSYLNGSAHRSTERSSFSGNETRGQLDFIARYSPQAAPDVIGRGMLGMFRYDATATLGRIAIPTLVITGDKDSVCLPEASHHMANAIPGAKLLTLANARHCGHFERHAQFCAAVAAFLKPLGVAQADSQRGAPSAVSAAAH